MQCRWLFLLLLALPSFLSGEKAFPQIEGHKGGYIALPKTSPINTTTYLQVKYSFEEFRKEEVSFVLLDLDTPGGEVFATLQILEELRAMEEVHKVPVIALIDDWALSAGALIAYSCPFIGAKKSSSMGAAEPVLASSSEVKTASEKMVSSLRTEFAKAAKAHGRDPLIAEAMVDRDMVLVVREGQTVELVNNDKVLPGDEVLSLQGKLLTLDGEELKALGIANAFFEDAGFLPLSGQALFSQGQKEEIEWVEYSNWKISFFAFLMHPFVSSILLFGLMIGVYSAMQGGLFTVTSLIGLISGSLLLLSTFATDLISSLEFLTIALGASLLALDLALLGTGFLVALGLILLVAGSAAALLPSLSGVPFSIQGDIGVILGEWLYRFSLFLLSIFLGLVVSALCSRFFLQRKAFGRRFVLQDKEEKKKEVLSRPLPGTIGIAFSAFRPFGKVEIDGIFYEGEAEGQFISQGARLRVLEDKGNRLVVEEVK